MTPQIAETTKVLAMNQGLYNGFLAAGLVWGAVSGDFKISLFFLGCVIIAGIVGGLTVNPKIFMVQSIPAIISLILVFVTRAS